MKSFSSFITEARRPKIRPDAKHGDEPGVTDKSDNIATVNITDEKLHELSPELVGKVHKARAVGGKPSKTIAASKTLSAAVRKAWLKTKVGKMKTESVGLDVTAKTPIPHVTISKTSHNKATNAPASAASSQAAATSRSADLQKNAEKEKEAKKNAAQSEIATRKVAEKLRKSSGLKPPEAPKAKQMTAPKI
jgi:hypothetical protein